MLTHVWKRLDNDANGNPRYATHFSALVPDLMAGRWGDRYSLVDLYGIAVKRANTVGGRKYNNRNFGGGIVFQSYCLEETEKSIEFAVDRASDQHVWADDDGQCH